MGKFDHRDVDVFVGVDMAKQDHYAQAITTAGTEVFHRPVLNDQAAIDKLLDDAGRHGRVALVIDMPSSAAQLLLTIAHGSRSWRHDPTYSQIASRHDIAAAPVEGPS